MEQSQAAGRTPMFINDKDGRYAAAYLNYHANIIDGKKFVMMQHVQKKPVDEIKEELRKTLVGALKYGKLLAVCLTNSAWNPKELHDPNLFPACFYKHAELAKKENYE
eukprot:gene56202-12380_t